VRGIRLQLRDERIRQALRPAHGIFPEFRGVRLMDKTRMLNDGYSVSELQLKMIELYPDDCQDTIALIRSQPLPKPMEKDPCNGCHCLLPDNLGCPERSHCIEYYQWKVIELQRQEDLQK